MKGPFERTVAACAVLLAAFLVGNAIVSYRNLRHLSHDAQQVAHTREVIQETERLLGSLRDIESGQRGFLISRDTAFLEPAEIAFAQYGLQLNRLRSLVSDNEDQSRRSEAISQLVEKRLAETRRCIEATRRGDIAAARAIVESGEGNRLMVRIRAEAEELERVEYALLDSRKGAATRAFEAASATILFSTIVGLAAVVTFAVMLARHLRARVRALVVLNAQRELFRSTLAGIDDAVIVTDLDGRITFANPAAERLTGWPAGEAVHHALDAVFRVEMETLVARDGTTHTVEQNVNPLRDQDGTLTGRVLVFRDIGERRRSESELRKLAASLAETDRRKDEFLATLAHELRNPLAPIRNGLEILRLTGTDATIQSVCDVMNRQLNHLVRLVDDLMDVSRISRNKLHLRLDRVDLASVIRTAIETCQPLIDANNLELTVSLPDEPAELSADYTRLAQVFSNLLNNAAKYTEPGGSITISALGREDRVEVRVQDSGIGIPPAMLDRVFDLFAQIESSQDRAQGGLGIGLMLVKRLVELHGGSVEAASEGEGRGSAFTVRLPLLRRRDPEPSTGSDSVPTGGLTRRVLVVDDNRDSAESLCRLLQLHGHEIHVAFDGSAAVEAFHQFQPNVVLLDLGLPHLNGFEVCRLIRSSPSGADVLVIAQTGWGQDEDRCKSHEAGFDHHLVKPVHAQTVLRLLAGPRLPRQTATGSNA